MKVEKLNRKAESNILSKVQGTKRHTYIRAGRDYLHPNKRKLILPQNCKICDAMRALNEVPFGIVMLVDSARKLVGVVTDGDIRRALVGKFSIESPVSDIMIREPVVIEHGYSRSQALRMFSWKVKQIPVVDDERRIVDLLLYSEFSDISKSDKDIIVRGRAPVRISFAGGGTDVDPYIEDKGGVVLSTTINKYCFGTLRKREDNRIIIYSRDYDLSVELDNAQSIKYDGRLDLIKAVIKLMKPQFGMELYLQSDVPPGTGMGGSATVASVTAGLINHLREDKFDDYQLAEIAFQAERIELCIDGGWQDQYAAVFGGFNFIEFKEEDVLVHPLKIKEDILNELECSLVLCFSGQTRVSGEIVGRQTGAFLSRDKDVTESLDELHCLAIEIKSALLKGDLVHFGRILDEAWQVKKRLDRNITNRKINRLYNTGIRAGAIGGKVLGAGGGGYILFVCPHLIKGNVANALQEEGGTIMDFGFDFRGLQTWAVRNNSES